MLNAKMSHFMTSRVSPLGVLSVYFIVASASARVGYEVESKNEDEEVCKSDVDGAEYRCAVGHCCADANCCTYYYELWWFWLIWMMIILMSCCCAYHHRKKRQNLRSRRNRTMMQGQYAAACSYPGPPVDKGTLGFCKLPKYDEIIRIPPSGSPPPPYRSHRNLNTIAAIEANSEGVASMKFLSYNDLTSSVLSLVTSIGFNFGQRSSHRQSNMRPQAYDSPDVSLSDSSSTFGNIEDEINNNTVPQHKHIVHIVNCHQNPLQRAETETNFVATSEQTILLEETPCTSANRSKSSPHISRLIGACSQEAPQDNASPLPQSAH
uniref:uncharacterized protein LOC120339513 n=1 Tax=Styela clava TaxID=7725 RepID=UPI00193A1DE8|nr:uncharacterized protein LOC120339513 [Styela clava]